MENEDYFCCLVFYGLMENITNIKWIAYIQVSVFDFN